MSGPRVIIPSMGRARIITTHSFLRDYLVCVPESQAKEYETELGKDKVLAHPDTVLAKAGKLNWVFDTFPDEDALVFLDDDLSGVSRIWRPPTETTLASTIKDPDLVHQIINNTYQCAKDAGAYLFGWSKSTAMALYYTGLSPFRVTGYVQGGYIGYIKGHGLRYDMRLAPKADFDISLQNALKHRFCWIDERFAFHHAQAFKRPEEEGKTSGARNSQWEAECYKLLKKKWGDCIMTIAPIKTGNPRMGLKNRAGASNLAIKLPY